MITKRTLTLPDGSSQELRRVSWRDASTIWSVVLVEVATAMVDHPALAVTREDDTEVIFFGDPATAIRISDELEHAHTVADDAGYDRGYESRGETEDDSVETMKTDMQAAVVKEVKRWREEHDAHLTEYIDEKLDELEGTLDDIEP